MINGDLETELKRKRESLRWGHSWPQLVTVVLVQGAEPRLSSGAISFAVETNFLFPEAVPLKGIHVPAHSCPPAIPTCQQPTKFLSLCGCHFHSTGFGLGHCIMLTITHCQALPGPRAEKASGGGGQLERLFSVMAGLFFLAIMSD